MSLVLYEIKKIFSKKAVCIFLAIFILLDVAKIYTIYNETVVNDPLFTARQSVIDEVKGTITLEKLNFIINKKRLLDDLIESKAYSTDYDSSTYSGYQFGDYRIFNDIYDELEYAYHYPREIDNVRVKAAENTEIFEKSSYQYNYARKILEVYKDRQITSYYDATGFEEYFSYDFSSLLILLFLLLTLSPTFSEEKELQMNLLLCTSPNGKEEITSAKFAAGAAVAVFTACLFTLTDTALFCLMFKPQGWENPLYSLESFKYTFFNGSLIQYAVICVILKIIGSIFFAFIYLLCSCGFKTTLLSIMCGGSCLALFIFISDYIQGSVSPLSIFVNRSLFQTFCVTDIFSLPVCSVYVLLCFVFVTSLFILIVVYKIQCKDRFAEIFKKETKK